MRQIEVVFLDFDGVILESVDIKGWAFGKLFEEYPDKVDEIINFHHANGGMSRFDKFRYIYSNILEQALSDETFDALCDRFSEMVLDRVLSCDFVPGAREFLENNYHRRRLYIVSGTPHDEIRMIVEKRKLERFFRGVYGSPTDKALWTEQIMRDNGYMAQKSIFVGDAMSDFRAARVNRLTFVARITDNRNVFHGMDIAYTVKDLFELDRLLNPEEKVK